MEYKCTQAEMLASLQTLVGESLAYGFKSPDCDLYDLGFGTLIDVIHLNGRVQKKTTFVIHAVCPIKVIKPKVKKAKWFYEDASAEKFQSWVQTATGLVVEKVGLSDKNDLWLDLGEYWIVFVTNDQVENDCFEDWRFFMANQVKPHLVASAFSAYMTK